MRSSEKALNDILLDDESRRKYQQIRDELAHAIRNGGYLPKQKLPSETQLARKYLASRGTVLRALLDLSHAGLIERRRGSGTFVKGQPAKAGGKFSLIAPPFPDSQQNRQGSVIAHMLRKIAEESGRRGYSLHHHALPENISESGEKLWQAVEQIVEQRSAGAFFLPFPVRGPETERLNREIARAMTKANIPIVLLDCDVTDRPGRSNFDIVSSDNQQGAAALTEHMIERGCRRIGFVTNLKAVSTISERILGYQGVLQKHGIMPLPNWVLHQPDLREESMKKIMDEFRFDGLIFKDDFQAALGCRHLAALGYRIGQDVKVGGFDDAPIATFLPVPLTTVRQPVDELALNAINLLHDRIQNLSQPGRMLMVNCELVVRESTKGPRAERN